MSSITVLATSFLLTGGSSQQPASSQPQTNSGDKTTPESPEKVSWKILADAVGSSKASQRVDAVSAVATIGPQPRVVELVEGCLHDKDEDVRRVATTTLGTMKSRSSISKLKQALDDDSPQVSFAAAQALWQMGDRSGIDIFYQILEGERKASKGIIRSEIADARKRLRNPSALALIGAEQAAGSFLGPFSTGISVAEALAKDSSAPTRALAANLLSSDRDSVTRQEFLDALGDKNWVVRAAAAKGLGNSERRDMIPFLQPLLDDKKDPVRYLAAASIVRLSSRPAGRSGSAQK